MRLHRLTVQAFGPFGDLATIDFDELNDAGLFLLTGATGAGKSSLLDAVCFAPLNKAALRAGGMAQEDELRWFADVLKHDAPCGEFNVLEQLWTSRANGKDQTGTFAYARKR